MESSATNTEHTFIASLINTTLAVVCDDELCAIKTITCRNPAGKLWQCALAHTGLLIFIFSNVIINITNYSEN